MSTEEADFRVVQRVVAEDAGIALEPRQGYLVASRLGSVARQEGFASVAALVDRLRGRPAPDLRWRVVEAITTNETSFFRDAQPFEALERTILPDLVRRRSAERALRIWSAGCASGQEPYSVAMVLLDAFPELRSWRVEILATDICEPVLERARAGAYTQQEVNRGLPARALVRHFRREGGEWTVSDRLRELVTFRTLNLSKPWPSLPPMDLVLMRNVLLYFAVPTKQDVLARVTRVLRPDGWLLLGSAETTMTLDDRFRRVPVGRVSGYRLDSEVPSHATA